LPGSEVIRFYILKSWGHARDGCEHWAGIASEVVKRIIALIPDQNAFYISLLWHNRFNNILVEPKAGDDA